MQIYVCSCPWGSEMLLRTQIFKSLLTVMGGGTGEDKKTYLGTKMQGVRAEFAGTSYAALSR